jgi:hypothetical protein
METELNREKKWVKSKIAQIFIHVYLLFCYYYYFLFVFTSMQYIYNYVPETNRVCRVFNVATLFYLQVVLHVMLFLQ